MHVWKTLLVLAALPAPALAQVPLDTKPATIVVTASGSVETAPDMATLTLTIRGEGKTPDAATSKLAAKQKAVIAGLRALDGKIDIRTGSISISEARSGDCDNRRGYTGDPESEADALSSAAADLSDMAEDTGRKPQRGPCVVIGRVAEIETTIIMRSVKDAGTAVGLAGRLGAREAKVENFGLHDEADASNRATAQAIASARAQAQTIAVASGAKLGPLVSVVDGSDRGAPMLMMYDVMQSAAPAVAPPPIVVDIAPKPVETNARLIVTFAIEK